MKPTVTAAEFLSRFPRVKKVSSGWLIPCPVPSHGQGKGDRNPSLSVSDGRAGIVLFCHAGCQTDAILAALDLTESDLFYDTPSQSANGHKSTPVLEEREAKATGTVTARFQYRDPETNDTRYEIERVDFTDGHKTFRFRRPNGRGGWTYKRDETALLLYRAPELASADPSTRVYIAEGEKCADALFAQGLLGTTAPFGAGKWRDEYAKMLQGRRVVVLADNDEPGRAHAEQVANSLSGVAASVRVLNLPGLPSKGDVADYFAAGGTREGLERLTEAAPRWTPVPDVNLDDLDDELDAALEAARDTTRWSFKKIGADFRFTFPDRTRIWARRVHRRGEGISCELQIENTAHGRLHLGSLLLGSTSGVDGLIKRLERKAPGLSWEHHIETVCWTVAQEYRRGDPEVCAVDIPRVRLQYAVTPFVLLGEINGIYGPGGTGKSTLAQALAVSVASGISLPGSMVPQPEVIGPSLFLDYETRGETFRRRVETIASALGADSDVMKHLWYRRMAAPIADDIEAVREIVDRRGVRFVVVDSWRPATGVVGGGDPADATIRAMEALRELNRTALIVGHSPKPQGDEKDRPSLYGSVFGANIVRSLVFVKSIGDARTSDCRVVLSHEKTNEVSAPPIGLSFRYGIDSGWGSRVVGIEEYDITTDPDAHTNVPDKMESTLRRERRKMLTSELATALDVKPNQIRSAGSQHKNVFGSESVAGTTEKAWFLLDQHRKATSQ